MTHTVSGKIIRGDGRGRKIGFPTANLELLNVKECPPDGVYAAWVEMNDMRYMAAVHIGNIPMFPKNRSTIEIHLLNFADQDLYGKEMTVIFVKKLRDSSKFNSIKLLIEAIKEDCKMSLDILKNHVV